MPLILAIESDHRQAGHLVQIVRRRLGAELILAETFEAALPAIGNRVPDFILVPALLSPEDDAALKFVLRAISHGSHVQVLTTPMFAGSRSESSSRRLLPGFLRPRTTGAAAGCDPEEFARHIASYLEVAAEQRATAQPPVISPAGLEFEAVTPVATPPVAPPPTESPVWEEELVAVDEVVTPVVAEEDVSDLSEPAAPIDMASEMEPAIEPVTTRTSPAVVDHDAFDRLVFDLNLLFGAAQVTPAAPVKPAPTLEQLAAEVDSRFHEIQPRPRPIESHPDPKATGDEWGLFDPSQCGLEALLEKLKPPA